jgi:hypothetical protein
MGLPSSGPRGGSFHASVISPRAMSSISVRNHMAVVNNAGFRDQIVGYNARENVVGRYYWHTYNGSNFCHYYDRWGCNWYGWYFGSSFYWSCWWGNNWWWYDPAYYRWCYWYDGWWWWQDPANVTVTYVYNNGQYVPEQPQEQAQTQNSDEASLVASAPAQNAKPLTIKTFRSKDGSRMVKLAGSGNDAFLYDTGANPAFKAKYLASDVQSAKFSKSADGSTQVTLMMKDGSNELYDADGNSVSNDQ